MITRTMIQRLVLPVLFLHMLGMSTIGCYRTQYHSGNASEYDGVYFGRVDSAGSSRSWDAESQSRNYFLFGLVPGSDADTFPADKLANLARGEGVVYDLEIKTQKSFLNGLIEVVVGIIPIVGFFRPFFLNLRAIEMEATEG